MIKAARLNVALRVRGFAALVQHTAASSAASPASLSLGRLVCLLDRQPQEGFIYPQLGTLMSSAPRPLAVCFVPGARHHAHEELAHRLGLKTIPRLLGREFGPAIVRPLNWPRRIENVERSLAILQGQLQSLLNFTAQDIAASQGPPRVLSQAAREAWRRKFDDATAPTILYSELHASMLDEMQAALLLEWLEFLEAIGNLGLERPHVHLFGISWDLLDRASEQQVEDRALAWLKAVEARNLKSVRVLAVPKLESCAWEHVTEWLDGEVLHHRRDLASRRDVLELALREFNNSSEFGLADFKSRVIAISAELHGAP
jgi:hypothetical protein